MKEMDRFKTAWQRQMADDGADVPGAAVASVERRLQAMHRSVRRRDLLETGTALAMIIFSLWLMVTLHGTLVHVGAAVIVGGMVLIVAKLARARGTGASAGTDVTVRDFCKTELASVDAQIRLLTSVAWWYLAPLTLGVNLVFVGVRGPTLHSLGYLAVTLLLAAFVYRLNQMAVTHKLRPIREQLVAILEEMATVEQPERHEPER